MPIEARFHLALLQHLPNGVYYVDTSRRILYWNEAAERLTGYPHHEVLGFACHDGILNHVDDQGTELCQGLCPLAATLRDAQQRDAHIYLRHRDGHRVPIHIRVSPVLDDAGQITGAIECFSDDTPHRKLLQDLDRMEKIAMMDPLTGMPNRRHLEEHLELRASEARRYGWSYGVILFDIDDFKGINDTFGHDTGDVVIRNVAKTLDAATRYLDIVGRWGGDEFLAVVSHLAQGDLIQVAERARLLVEQTVFRTEPEAYLPRRVTISGGLATFREGESTADVLKRADERLYHSKALGRNRMSW